MNVWMRRKIQKYSVKLVKKCFQEFLAGSLIQRVFGLELIIAQNIENGHSNFPRKI